KLPYRRAIIDAKVLVNDTFVITGFVRDENFIADEFSFGSGRNSQGLQGVNVNLKDNTRGLRISTGPGINKNWEFFAEFSVGKTNNSFVIPEYTIYSQTYTQNTVTNPDGSVSNSTTITPASTLVPGYSEKRIFDTKRFEVGAKYYFGR
ncbi:MAG: hypothetical protein ABL927_08335, partial [Bdellovibrionales bacterium]